MRAILFALSEDNAREAMLALARDKKIEIAAWLGTDKGHGVIDYDYGVLTREEIQKEIAMSCPPAVYDSVYGGLYRFLDMAYRNGTRPIYEYVNLFNLWLSFYYGLFQKKKPDVLIFSDIPHFGVDSIAKDLANAMGIPVVMVQQALGQDMFFAFSNIEDIGIYESLANREEVEIELKKEFEKDLFYMKNTNVVVPRSSEKGSGKERLKKLWKKIQHNRGRIYTKGRLFALRKAGGYFSTKEERLASLLEAKRMFGKCSVDLTENFVYFPLHLQPELTTSALGGKFCDQILAIERLREFIPEDWKIYVKENPKQSYYMRGELFFRRLNNIKNVEYVPRSVNTYDLIRGAKFVATITGTAGWEAVSGGKPVLVFGLAWYRSLPGVFEYRHCKYNAEEIANFSIDHEAVSAAYNALLSKAYPGIIECGHEKALEIYSERENHKKIYDSMEKILAKVAEMLPNYGGGQ